MIPLITKAKYSRSSIKSYLFNGANHVLKHIFENKDLSMYSRQWEGWGSGFIQNIYIRAILSRPRGSSNSLTVSMVTSLSGYYNR